MLITGPTGKDKKAIAKGVERALFSKGRHVYFLGIGNLLRGLDADIGKRQKQEHIRRLGEVSHILMDAGMLVIATASDLDNEDIKLIETIIGDDNIITVSLDDDIEHADLVLNQDSGLNENIDRIINLLKFKHIIFNNETYHVA